MVNALHEQPLLRIIILAVSVSAAIPMHVQYKWSGRVGPTYTHQAMSICGCEEFWSNWLHSADIKRYIHAGIEAKQASLELYLHMQTNNY